MTDIDRTYTVTRVHRADGWVTLELETKGCSMHQIICITEGEEARCYGGISAGDAIYLRFLD